jgi:hypothetical protein
MKWHPTGPTSSQPMICCRNTRISASNAARGRNRSTTIPKIILQRSNIPQKIIRFYEFTTGTGDQ